MGHQFNLTHSILNSSSSTSWIPFHIIFRLVSLPPTSPYVIRDRVPISNRLSTPPTPPPSPTHHVNWRFLCYYCKYHLIPSSNPTWIRGETLQTRQRRPPLCTYRRSSVIPSPPSERYCRSPSNQRMNYLRDGAGRGVTYIDNLCRTIDKLSRNQHQEKEHWEEEKQIPSSQSEISPSRYMQQTLRNLLHPPPPPVDIIILGVYIIVEFIPRIRRRWVHPQVHLSPPSKEGNGSWALPFHPSSTWTINFPISLATSYSHVSSTPTHPPCVCSP